MGRHPYQACRIFCRGRRPRRPVVEKNEASSLFPHPDPLPKGEGILYGTASLRSTSSLCRGRHPRRPVPNKVRYQVIPSPYPLPKGEGIL